MSDTTECMRYSEMVRWLKTKGLNESTVKALIDNKRIKGRILVGGRKHYFRSQIQADVLEFKEAA